MIVILEGADMTGKTSLANHLIRNFGAKYLHMTYRFAGKEFAYHTAVLKKALQLSRRGHMVVLDRCWMSESIYSRVYRNGSKYGLMGRYMERVLAKANVLYIICAPNNIEEYAEKYRKLAKERNEMYPDPTVEVAEWYDNLWYGTIDWPYDSHDYIGNIICSGGLYKKGNATRYVIEQDPDYRHISERVYYFQITNSQERFKDVNNFIGRWNDSSVLLVGERPNPTYDGTSKVLWPFHRYKDSSLFFTRWLNTNNVPEEKIAWVNIYQQMGPEIIREWHATHRADKIVVMGNSTEKRFNETCRNIDYIKTVHPQAANRFPSYSYAFSDQMYEVFYGSK